MGKLLIALLFIIFIGALFFLISFPHAKHSNRYEGPVAIAPYDASFQVVFEIKNSDLNGIIYLNGVDGGLSIIAGEVTPAQKYLFAGTYNLEIQVKGKSIANTEIALLNKSTVICEVQQRSELSCLVQPR